MGGGVVEAYLKQAVKFGDYFVNKSTSEILVWIEIKQGDY